MVIALNGSKCGLTAYKTMLRSFLLTTGHPQRQRRHRASVHNCEKAVPLSFLSFIDFFHYSCFTHIMFLLATTAKKKKKKSPEDLIYLSIFLQVISFSFLSTSVIPYDTHQGLTGGGKHSSSPAKGSNVNLAARQSKP